MVSLLDELHEDMQRLLWQLYVRSPEDPDEPHPYTCILSLALLGRLFHSLLLRCLSLRFRRRLLPGRGLSWRVKLHTMLHTAFIHSFIQWHSQLPYVSLTRQRELSYTPLVLDT